MFVRSTLNLISATCEVLGIDKRKVGNCEFSRDAIYAKDVIDVDELYNKGYDLELIKALLGQEFVEKSLLSYFKVINSVAEKKKKGSINLYLSLIPGIYIFRELYYIRFFWCSYRTDVKAELSFPDMAAAYFEYIGWDLKKLIRNAGCDSSDRKAIKRYLKNAGSPFDAILKESKALWEDLAPFICYCERHYIPFDAIFFGNEGIDKGTAHLLPPIQDEIRKRVEWYDINIKRNYLERIGIEARDVSETEYEKYFIDLEYDWIPDERNDYRWVWCNVAKDK